MREHCFFRLRELGGICVSTLPFSVKHRVRGGTFHSIMDNMPSVSKVRIPLRLTLTRA